jgi:glycosyltransferase involved in cell wall biosynthesis
MKDLSIIIPAYNEAERISPTLHRFHQFLSTSNLSYEIIVIDDGSADNTAQLVTELSKKLPCLYLKSLPQNRGKGAAVRAGMLSAVGKLRLFSDADCSTPPEEMVKLLDALKEGVLDIAIGSRYLEASEVIKPQPRLRIMWSRLTNKVVQRMLLPGIGDPHCGFKVFTASAAQQVFSRCRVDGWSFDLESLAIASRLGFNIREVPVKWVNDERSKGKIRHLPKEIRSVYRIRKRLRVEGTMRQ